MMLFVVVSIVRRLNSKDNKLTTAAKKKRASREG